MPYRETVKLTDLVQPKHELPNMEKEWKVLMARGGWIAYKKFYNNTKQCG
jgi:hypothetical protein